MSLLNESSLCWSHLGLMESELKFGERLAAASAVYLEAAFGFNAAPGASFSQQEGSGRQRQGSE